MRQPDITRKWILTCVTQKKLFGLASVETVVSSCAASPAGPVETALGNSKLRFGELDFSLGRRVSMRKLGVLCACNFAV